MGQFVHVIRKRIKLSSEKVSFALSNTPPPSLTRAQAICVFVNNVLPPTGISPSSFSSSAQLHSLLLLLLHSAPLPLTPLSAALITTIYAEHADEDGFLYITYNGENTFGSAL